MKSVPNILARSGLKRLTRYGPASLREKNNHNIICVHVCEVMSGSPIHFQSTKLGHYK